MNSGSRNPRRLAVIGFVAATAVALVIGIVGYGDPLPAALATAVAIGLGVSVTFYLFYREPA